MEEGFLGSEDEYLLHLSLGDSISATLELIHVIELETNSTIYLLNINKVEYHHENCQCRGLC